MLCLPYPKVKKNLESILDSVIENKEPTLITRQDAENVVIMSQTHFDSLMETLQLLSQPDFKEKFKQSVNEANSGQVASFEEVFGEPL